MSGGAERAAIAREVLTDLAETLGSESNGSGGRVLRYRDEHFPAPPAPVTVTVTIAGVEFVFTRGDTQWTSNAGHVVSTTSCAHFFAERIAADAARIAALEDSVAEWEATCRVVEAERDEARRALETKGDGLGAAALKSEREAGEESSATVAAATKFQSHSPAPIPLGAVVEVEGDEDAPYTCTHTGWHDRWMCLSPDEEYHAKAITALYHARHPVATRETVERVRDALHEADRQRAYLVPAQVYTALARAALRAAGFTVEEGA